MAITEQESLPDVYKDFSDEQFFDELARVHQATQVERDWFSEVQLVPYESDTEIIDAVNSAQRPEQRVVRGMGFRAIRCLADWDLSRSSPEHQFHYSPSVLREGAASILQIIASRWSAELGGDFELSVTSMARSLDYQRRLNERPRKLAVDVDEGLSSHLFGLAFDIDGCGLYGENGRVSYNPRMRTDDGGVVERSRNVLKNVLTDFQASQQINYVEELPGTQQHTFHVCANPLTI